MIRDDILHALRDHMSEIKAFGVSRVALFGSFVRGEERPDSNVDILVEFSAPVGFFEFVRLQRYLKRLLGREVDLVTPDAVVEEMRAGVLSSRPMSPGDSKTCIRDILEAIEKIQEYTKGASLESLPEKEKTVDAVVHNLTVISEAAQKVPAEIQKACPAIPWDDMRDMRNVVVHDDFRVSYPILWRTVQSNLPPLVGPLKGILKETDA